MYVDDIIFGFTNPDLVLGFEKLMKIEFEISMIGEITFFLGLQVMQDKDDIQVHQKKYLNKVVKKFGMENLKPYTTLMSPNTRIDINEKGIEVDQR